MSVFEKEKEKYKSAYEKILKELSSGIWDKWVIKGDYFIHKEFANGYNPEIGLRNVSAYIDIEGKIKLVKLDTSDWVAKRMKKIPQDRYYNNLIIKLQPYWVQKSSPKAREEYFNNIYKEYCGEDWQTERIAENIKSVGEPPPSNEKNKISIKETVCSDEKKR